MSKSLAFAASVVALAISGVAVAQDVAPALQIQAGQVMTSTGGEFVTAQNGQALVVGQRVMVAEDSSARIVYPNGCVVVLENEGVFVVAPTATCDAAIAARLAGRLPAGAGARTAITLSAIGGVAAAAALLGAIGDDDDRAVSR